MGTMSYFGISKCVAGVVHLLRIRLYVLTGQGSFVGLETGKHLDQACLQEGWPRLDHT